MKAQSAKGAGSRPGGWGSGAASGGASAKQLKKNIKAIMPKPPKYKSAKSTNSKKGR